MIEEDEGGDLTTAEQYQAQRLSSLPAIYRTQHERLACELALGLEDPESIFTRYGYTEDQTIHLLEHPPFQELCSRVEREIRESGFSFKMKARVQAEELLQHSFAMATDPLASAAVRADLIKWTTRVAGLEPKEDKDSSKTGGGLNLSITFAGQAPMKVVQHQPELIEGE